MQHAALGIQHHGCTNSGSIIFLEGGRRAAISNGAASQSAWGVEAARYQDFLRTGQGRAQRQHEARGSMAAQEEMEAGGHAGGTCCNGKRVQSCLTVLSTWRRCDGAIKVHAAHRRTSQLQRVVETRLSV
jgi:hypothetical protein